MKIRLVNRGEDGPKCFLHDAVSQGGDAQRALFAIVPEPANRGVTRSNATPAAGVLRLCRRMALAVPATAARTSGTRSLMCNTHLLLCVARTGIHSAGLRYWVDCRWTHSAHGGMPNAENGVWL